MTTKIDFENSTAITAIEIDQYDLIVRYRSNPAKFYTYQIGSITNPDAIAKGFIDATSKGSYLAYLKKQGMIEINK